MSTENYLFKVMTRSEISEGVKQVIADNSPFNANEILLTDPLARFISAGFKDRLAREVKRSFRKINTTRLTNLLYDSIKKVSQLVDHIDAIYNPTA
jgi:hypothetical protein